MRINHSDLGVHEAFVVFVDFNPRVEKTAAEGMRGIMQQWIFHPSRQQQNHPDTSTGGVQKCMTQIQSGKKEGICKNDFEFRLFDRLQISIFNIAAMADIVPHQKS